jgi:hypothetical protein
LTVAAKVAWKRGSRWVYYIVSIGFFFFHDNLSSLSAHPTLGPLGENTSCLTRGGISAAHVTHATRPTSHRRCLRAHPSGRTARGARGAGRQSWRNGHC